VLELLSLSVVLIEFKGLYEVVTDRRSSPKNAIQPSDNFMTIDRQPSWKQLPYRPFGSNPSIYVACLAAYNDFHRCTHLIALAHRVEGSYDEVRTM
jgi:hypothetical protein